MLKNFSTKVKLMTIPIAFVGVVIFSAILYTHYNNQVKFRANEMVLTNSLIQELLKSRIAVYQFLRASTEKNSKKLFDTLDVLSKNLQELKTIVTEEKSLKTCNTILADLEEYTGILRKVSVIRIEDFKQGKMESEISKQVAPTMVRLGVALEKNIHEINNSATKLKGESESSLQMALIIMALISTILFIIFSITLSNIISSSLEKFKEGLSQFFAFINRETQESSLLEIDGKDEFAMMAKEVNESINKTKEGLIKDNEVVKEVLAIVEKANQGYLDLEVKNKANNPQLVQLSDALSSMLKGIKVNVDSINGVLSEYSNYKFTSKISEDGIHGDIATLIKNVNFMTDEISKLLKNSYVIGLTLDNASDQLLINVDILNKSSNEAAASLEETAAALEEITSTIINNAENVQSMSDYANKLGISAKSGQKLAHNTSTAMDEINEQVTAINEAISVIDQIAFQTNILSLNAAVEAATAGEAGKGFAVVAQEVRNLASRSAEAAKEIKELVETATSKAADGKQISSQMINGYDELLENLTKSTEKISEIANASKEQEQGISQINDAVSLLDQQTQQNALTAGQTQDIAVDADSIAKEIVEDAKSKDFIGKDEAKARPSTGHKSVYTPAKNVHKAKEEIKPIKSKPQEIITPKKEEEDDWESF